ncbi:MAG: glycosyltransferase family 2 protein [Thermoplasmatales archaeon]
MRRITLTLFTLLYIVDIAFIVVGIVASILASYRPGATILDDIFSTLFWAANIFFGIQSVAYVLNFRRSKSFYPVTVESALNRSLRDKVAVLVPIFNEDPEMVSTNLMAILNSANEIGKVYVLDDSTDGSSEKTKSLCDSLGIPYIHRTDRHGYKAGALNNVLKNISEEYVAVIDIDQMPSPDFLRETITLLDRDPSLALVQVPQYYSNLDTGVLANVANGQQFIFYEILTEGKSVVGSMFSCGTNVVYRKKALESVGYFDESSLVEDIATSVNMISKGWKTLYYNKKLLFGRAPVTMEGYVNQQYRWASGSLALIPRILKDVILSKNFSISAKVDWFASAIWYLYGWFYLIFLISPILATLGIRVLSLNLMTYLIAWVPYTILNLGTFIVTHLDKKASLRTVYYNLAASTIMFPVSIMATIGVILKRRKPFKTARTGGKIPWYRFWPQFTIMFGLIISIFFLVSSGSWYGYVTAFWAAFQLILLLPIFWLNRSPKPSIMDAKTLIVAR